VAKFYEYFKQNGYTLVNSPEHADYILVSTCAFKKEEEDTSFERISTLRAYNAKLLVYGCLPEIAPARFKTLPHVNWVSPKNINTLDDHFENIKYKISEISDVNTIPVNITHPTLPNAINKFVKEFTISKEFLSRSARYAKDKLLKSMTPDSKYYLFISKGCLGKCSYCAIRHAVGTLKSKPVDVILEELSKGEEAGYRDITLLGDDVGAYGLDNGSDFPGLLSALLERANGHISFHIEEIHPKWMVLYKDRLLELIASGKIKSILCPVQSGNDRILELMRREHDAATISELFLRVRSMQPGLRLTTQIIAGFPSETDDEFIDTLQFLGRVRFDAVTIFAYDEKENVLSGSIAPKVPEAVIHQRVQEAQHYLHKQKIDAFLSCPK
jgi:tRNA A37 methylthiotransferase MiaB